MAKPGHCSNVFLCSLSPKYDLELWGPWRGLKMSARRGFHWNCPAALLMLISTSIKKKGGCDNGDVCWVWVRGRHDNPDRFCSHHFNNKPNWAQPQLCELTLSLVICVLPSPELPSSYYVCLKSHISVWNIYFQWISEVRSDWKVPKNAVYYCRFAHNKKNNGKYKPLSFSLLR